MGTQADKETSRTSPPPAEAQSRVLVVDDEFAVRMLLANVLKRECDCEVMEATDGLDAQPILLREHPDVVVTDLRMPRMGGLALLQWATENGLRPVWIILSGAGSFRDAVKAIHLGAFDYIPKPMESNDSLVITVRNALRQRKLERERARLLREVEQRNTRLRSQVCHLDRACRLLSEQAKTIEQDLHRAERIQRALLPQHPPAMEGLAFHSAYRTSRHVGGDLYDILPIGPRQVAFYVADAAGHGVSAAMLSVLLKNRICPCEGRPPRPRQPRDVLEDLNRCLVAECKAPGLFITCAYGLLEGEPRRLTVASAGHCPALLARPDGAIESIEHTGPAMGLRADARYEQCESPFGEGARLLLYTDGLLDALAAQAAGGVERLCDLLRGDRGAGKDLVGRVLSAAGGEPHADDMTVLLVAAAGEPSSLDHGQQRDVSAEPPAETAAEGDGGLLVGERDGRFVVSVEGKGDWTHSTVLHDACQDVLEEGQAVRMDLSHCPQVDSTFLGTVHELTVEAEQRRVPIDIDGVQDPVRRQFEELGMEQALQHMHPTAPDRPPQMTPLAAGGSDDNAHRRRIISAHEHLAALNATHREEFLRLVQAMRKEMELCQSR